MTFSYHPPIVIKIIPNTFINITASRESVFVCVIIEIMCSFFLLRYGVVAYCTIFVISTTIRWQEVVANISRFMSSVMYLYGQKLAIGIREDSVLGRT